mmetsp:Transcript_21207/g.50273  ORF Transcript_21207/g.50273 Transcript_21207/m.50273 type:complete len:203 (+) Transcript_21207:874-1482(+)
MAWTRRPSSPSSQAGRAGPQNWRHRTRPSSRSPSSQRGGRRSRRAAAWGSGRRKSPPCRTPRLRSSGWHHTHPRRSPGRAWAAVTAVGVRVVAVAVRVTVAVAVRVVVVRPPRSWASPKCIVRPHSYSGRSPLRRRRDTLRHRNSTRRFRHSLDRQHMPLVQLPRWLLATPRCRLGTHSYHSRGPGASSISERRPRWPSRGP